MPNSSSQTENQTFQRRYKNYFDCEEAHKKRYRNKIRSILEESDLKLFCDKIGLRIGEIKFTPNDHVNYPPKLSIAPFYMSKELKVYKWMCLRDLVNISCKKYEFLRKFLKKNYIETLPCLDGIRAQQINLDNSYVLYQNDQGFFLCPKQKIQFVCEKFLERNDDFVKSGSKIIKIRLCADGVQISKKHLQCLNFAFTILSDERNCKSVFHTYVLGNKKAFFFKEFFKFFKFIKKKF